MNILLFTGPLKPSEILDVFNKNKKNKIKCLIVNGYEDVEFRRIFPNSTVWNNRNLVYEMPKNEGEFHSKYDLCIKKILNDINTHILAERLFRRGNRGSHFNSLINIEIITWNSLFILSNCKINKVIFCAKPHNIVQWILAKVSEILNIPVLYPQISLLRNRFKLFQHTLKHKNIKLLKNTNFNEKRMILEIDSFIKETRGSFEKIKNAPRIKILNDKYNREFFKVSEEIKFFLKNFSLKNPFKFIIDRPNKLTDAFKKKRLLNLHRKIEIKKNKIVENKKILSLFLHSQPERSTMPDGDIYSQQWLIVRSLSRIAKKYNFVIYIKENPATFRDRFESRYRSEFFYNSINKIENVFLADLDFNSFELIDLSFATASITGSCIVESIIRGIPTLTFSLENFGNCKGIYQILNFDDLRKIVPILLKKDYKINQVNVRNYLLNLYKNTISRKPGTVINKETLEALVKARI